MTEAEIIERGAELYAAGVPWREMERQLGRGFSRGQTTLAAKIRERAGQSRLGRRHIERDERILDMLRQGIARRIIITKLEVTNGTISGVVSRHVRRGGEIIPGIISRQKAIADKRPRMPRMVDRPRRQAPRTKAEWEAVRQAQRGAVARSLAEQAPTDAKRIWELEHHDCTYIYGEPRGLETAYCGKPGRPWCSKHAALVWGRGEAPSAESDSGGVLQIGAGASQ